MKNDIVSLQKIPNILIVDDIPANLKVLGDILKGDGYKVRPVPNGMLALQVAEKEKPDLILLDIMMPDMDGYEVCRRLKENKDLSGIPVIFISALNETDDIVKALTSGGADYITKPFKAEEVKARVATHLKIYHQSKELIELNANKDKFFSIIAHDLRGPLGGFMGLTEMMAGDVQYFTDHEKKNLLLDLSRSARNIFNLLENLLEWSQMKRGNTTFEPQILILRDVVSDCVKIVTETARKKSINIIVNIPVRSEVFADTNMLQTVMRNLISNAIKFTRRGGKITVSAKPATFGKVEISVKDTGIGIKPEMIENLFRPDVSSNRKGTEDEASTGLGLLLCKEFIDKHGGKIWVESNPEGIPGEQGSIFYFTIQGNIELVAETVLPILPPVVFEEHNTKLSSLGLKILIAEDDYGSAKLIEYEVKSYGKQILNVTTGVEAVEACLNNPDIDLILMDVQMPDMDGYEATRLIRQFNSKVVIIAQTAYALPEERKNALAAGCNDYIAKPILKDLLLEMISNQFNN